MQRALLRRRSRRHERGAVFVEAIIVSSVLILFMLSGLFLHHAYALKIGALSSARGAAWQQSLEGCRGALDPGKMFGLLVNFGNPSTLTPPAMADQLGPVDHTQGTAAASITAPARLGGDSYGLGASVQLACNEQIQGERGDLFDIALYAAENFLPSFF